MTAETLEWLEEVAKKEEWHSDDAVMELITAYKAALKVVNRARRAALEDAYEDIRYAIEDFDALQKKGTA